MEHRGWKMATGLKRPIIEQMHVSQANTYVLKVAAAY